MGKKYNKVLAGILAMAILLSVMSFDRFTLEGKQSNENRTESVEDFDTETDDFEETETSEESEKLLESEEPSASEKSAETGESADLKNALGFERPAEEPNPVQGDNSMQIESSTEEKETESNLKEEKASEETENVTETEDEVSEKTEETEETQDDAKQQMVYTLNIVHTLRYVRDGKEKHVQEYDVVKLTHKDFGKNGYNLLRHVYVHEALTAALAPGCPDRILESDFRDDGNGGKEFDVEFRYTLKEGWLVYFPGDAGYQGISFYGVYQGSFSGAEFKLAEHITVTIQYKYSDTGGLAGIDAHSPDVIDLILDDNGAVDLTDWKVPHYDKENPDYHGHSHENLEGFRIVLDPEPLNQFVKDPNGTLENGDFNLRDDVDITSQEYQEAWDAARRKYVAGESGREVLFSYIAPVENGGTSQTTSSDPDKIYCLNAVGLTEDLTLTVYYRRDAGTYTVKHWKPADGVTNPVQGNETDWSLIESEEFPGRAGTLTDAKQIEDSRVAGYTAAAFSQETIKSDGSTVINIYYTPKLIRVIFDTDDIYIERQQVPLGGYVELETDQEKMDRAKPGYRFAGWQYRPYNGNESDRSDIFPADAETTDRFQLTQEFLKNAWIDESVEAEGVEVLRIYPKWVPDTTSVRVVFWTEDLNGNDVEVTKYNYNFNTKQKIPGATAGKITHQTPGDGKSFSNAGSFEITDTFHTGDTLVENGKLVDALQTEITNHENLLGSVTVSGQSENKEVDISNFYERYETDGEIKGFNVLVESVSENGTVTEEEATTAAANGSTLVYVYYKRKVYRLDFDYYFQMPHEKVSGAQEGAAQIITETSWFSDSSQNNWAKFEKGEAYPDSGFQNVDAEEINSSNMPVTTAISAKYGADLRSVWPADEESRYVVGDKLRVSWATTLGLHNKLSPGGNINVPGAYSTMNAAIVADVEHNDITHHLVAFWANQTNNTYRYNYCYEVPELTAEEVSEYKSVKIFNDSSASEEDDIRNTIYLVPEDHEVFLKYGFTDLLTLDEISLAEKADSIEDVADPENYYVIRIYEGKCYAISRQLVAISALAVENQNPSARPCLTLVNARSDHSTEVSGEGSGNKGYDNFNNPYDIYFYYIRDRFTITYMSDATTEIGQLELPYGTTLYENKYAYELDYKKTNGDYAEPNLTGGWSLLIQQANGSAELSANLPVCPERSPDGTKKWNFNGWFLGPAGVRMMQWENGENNVPVILESNLILYASWEAPQYKVSFDWNHGSFTNEEDAELLKEQLIPGNRSFVNYGGIPRPIRDKFILKGWVITARGDEAGNKVAVEPDDGIYPQFLFEQPINQDLWVRAEWEALQAVELSYTVYYLVQNTDTPVRDSKTITGTYLPGTTVWASPEKPTQKEYENYIPLTQNQSVILSADSENKIIFYYSPPLTYGYTVKFNIWNTQETVLEFQEKTEKVLLQICPTQEHIDQLNELGYYIVDTEGRRATQGDALTTVIMPAEKEEVVTYYVLPDTYSIIYQNMEAVMGSEAVAALHNPTTYTTAEGAGRLNNPTGTYTDAGGKTVQFVGWRMVKTREVSGIRDFENGKEIAESVTIEKGSRGNLIFSAVWYSESDSNRITPSGTPEDSDPSDKIPIEPEISNNPKTPVQSGDGGGLDSSVTLPSPDTPGLGLPQTGAAWWFVCLLAFLGTLMLTSGLLLTKRDRKG